MKLNNRQNKCIRTVDGDEVWDSRSVVVVGMILMRHEGEIYVLIGKRGEAFPNEVGKWCLPCGYLDWDETCEEAVFREIYEETGLNINKAMSQYEVLVDQVNYPWKINSIPDGETQNVSLHYALYMDTKINMHRDKASLPELSIENNPELGEVDEVKWIRVEDLALYDMAFNHDKTIKIFVNNLPIIEE